MECKICSNNSYKIFEEKVLFNKYNVSFYRCSKCGFVQTETPYWLEESYKNAFTYIDLPLVRCIKETKKAALICQFFEKKHEKFLDYAGGYGIFSRLMRDIGFDFVWDDIYAQNIFSKNFEYNSVNDKISLITTYESFEHLVDPISEIEKIIKIAPNILFSTTLIGEKIPEKNWFYWGFEHGQHIAFYNIKSLKFIANKFNLNLYSFKNLHLFTTKKIPPLFYSILIMISYFFGYKMLSFFKKSKISEDQKYLKNLYLK
jgi:hypothetical protein